MKLSSQRGQSLIELVAGIAIGVLFITAAIGIITVSLKIDFQNKFSQTASELTQETLEQVATFANADWHNIDTLTTQSPYHLVVTGSFFTSAAGSSTQVIAGASYDSSFAIEPVYRNSSDAFSDNVSGSLDPQTLKIVAATQWAQQNGDISEIRFEQYLTRRRDRVWIQNDWSSGSSSWPGSPATEATMNQGWFSNATNTDWATPNQLTIHDLNQNLQNTPGNGIDSTYRYAWNDVVGWFDFRVTNTVTVGSTITGYAQHLNGVTGLPTLGDMALDCATSPNGNICASSNFKVNQDVNGVLDGYAWDDSIGWISFNCSNQNQCATTAPCPTTNPTCTAPTGGVDYNVRIASGVFYGWAWNDIIGWISFNCDHSADIPATPPPNNTNSCGQSNYYVKTGSSQVAWGEVESVPFDTLRAQGAGFNTIVWEGIAPSGTNVKFQIAANDNPSNPINFVGPDGTANSYYQPTGPGIQMRLSRSVHNNQKYMYYRAILESDPGLQFSPTITKIVLNWSH